MNINCAACGNSFTSDNTPMAARAICMMCRPTITVTCTGCEQNVPGSYDGELWCQTCRAAEYHKHYLYADTTGGRLWRLTTAGLTPDW